ncbi:M56 family metallopeptidase [Winogradskyella alexanderae]|uniref:Peptidase M56 domain-containing protein n=1 Tax=Winogradskyella alexanderae TaxID=2877123 RepID=A0ABS7XS45_9FLAO|nr:M56 family metallopeptidase [Winogradskyella alexanderae]MCA0132585.1 hypothetical protein [Winogradskyella alexanderae]
MGIYLLKFSACLLVFWLVYTFLLEQQNIHRFKRFYLLGSFVMALIIPMLTITYYVEPVAQQLETLPVYIPIESSNTEILVQPTESISTETLLWYLYGLGVLIFSFRFVVNLIKLYRNISTNSKIFKSSFIYVLLKEYRIPHSFFKYIFLNKTKFENEAIPIEVLLHEEAHAKQLHSLDIVLIELLQIAFWFHPLVYILKHHVKLNHEFLADQAVLNHGIDRKNYQNTLLQFSSNTPDYQLTSAINYSSFKKRFTVMKSQTSNIKKLASTILLLPVIAMLFYSFAEREYVKKETEQTQTEIKNELKKAIDYDLTHIDITDPIKAYLKKYEAYKKLQDTPPHYINKGDLEKKQMDDLFSDLGGMYFRMLKADKAKVLRPTQPVSPYAKITLNGKTYYKKKSELTQEEKATLPPPPPPAMKKSKGGPNSVDTPEVYNTDYARSIELKILDNNSYVIDGIKATKKTFVSVFNQMHQDITPEVRNRILNIHVSSSKDVSNEEVWFIYNSLKDYGFYHLVTPNQIVNRAKGNTPFAIESGNIGQQNPPTQKEIDAYNAWAKKKKEAFKKRPKSETVNGYPYLINDETFRYYNSIYDRMTSEQKKKSVALPEAVLVTEWPMPEYTVVETISQPIQEKATKQQIEEYNAWAKKVNVAMRKARANKSNEYPIVKQKELDRYINIYKNLMTAEQRQNAERFPSPPPPPPPPPSPLETIKTKAKSKTKQHNNVINKVEITIKKDKSLVLNGKQVALADLVEEVKKLNQHLTVEQQKEYVFASVMVESNDHVSFSKEIQEKLRKANVYHCAIGYNETKLKTGLPIKHFNLNEGLTVEEARKEREKMLRGMDEGDKTLDKTIDSLNKKDNNKWSYTVETSFVESEPKMKELKYNGDTYSYYLKNDKKEYVFYDKYGLIVDKTKIKTLTDHVRKTKKQ